jgi:hypothetical protein
MEEPVAQLLPKLCAACYAIKTVMPYVNQETLLMVCCAYLPSIMHYGIIFWGNPSYATNVSVCRRGHSE